jgi:hypothetical protein
MTSAERWGLQHSSAAGNISGLAGRPKMTIDEYLCYGNEYL